MPKTILPVYELKRRAIAELDRRLGPHGTVMDLTIEPVYDSNGRPSWGIAELRHEAEPQALQRLLSDVLPRLQQQYGLETPADQLDQRRSVQTRPRRRPGPAALPAPAAPARSLGPLFRYATIGLLVFMAARGVARRL